MVPASPAPLAPSGLPGQGTGCSTLRGAGIKSARGIACLRALSARHGLPHLEPRTFWEVAQAMGQDPRA